MASSPSIGASSDVDELVRESQRRLMLRLFALGSVLVVVLTGFMVVLSARNANDVASALSKSYRNQLLLGQYREPIHGLSTNVPITFSSVSFEKDGRVVFEVPNGETASGYLQFTFTHKISLSEESGDNFGALKFRISPWETLFWCVLIYAVLFLIGYPLARRSFRQAREQVVLDLKQRQREEFSILARQIAHDIRSPLSAISVAAHAVKSSNQKASTMMIAASERIQRMASQLLEFAKQGSASVEPVISASTTATSDGLTVSKAIGDVFAEHMNGRSSGVLTLAGNIPFSGKLQCDSDVLARILSNLIRNAEEAVALVDREGKVEIRAEPDGHDLCITIEDNGAGISADNIALVLAGTSIGKVNGNGLGLSHARRSIESWGGVFRLESVEGQGTRITLRIPQADA